MLKIINLYNYLVVNIGGEKKPVFIARVLRTDEKGEKSFSYACYHPYGAECSLPTCFTVIGDEDDDFFGKVHIGTELSEIVKGKIIASWNSLSESKSSEYYQIFRFLNCFAPESDLDGYLADMVIEAKKPKYLFPWDTILVGTECIHIKSNRSYKGYWSLLKLSDKDFKKFDFDSDYLEFDGLYIEGDSLTALDGEIDGHEEIIEVVLPRSVKYISSGTFRGCRELTQLFIAEDCKIWFNAFRGNGDFGETTHIYLM